MDNKKYLDKVIGSLVRGTKIDYENERVIFSHFSFLFPSSSLTRPPYVSLSIHPRTPYFHRTFFFQYCTDMFGLTEGEIEYVWKEYKEIIENKIEDGE